MSVRSESVRGESVSVSMKRRVSARLKVRVRVSVRWRVRVKLRFGLKNDDG